VLPLLSEVVDAVIGIDMAMRGPSGGSGFINRRLDVGSAVFGGILFVDAIGGGGGGGGFGAV
jgi:hypothetical protein